jgi:hypothetical protein
MPTPLTLAQTIGVATGIWASPMRASSLIKLYGTASKPLSVLSVRDKLQARKNILILQLRNPAILDASPTLAALETNWASLNPAYVPTQQSLANFAKILKASGVSVLKISQDWRTAAISGTTLSFASIPTQYFKVTGQLSTQSSVGSNTHTGPSGGSGPGSGTTPAQSALGGGLVAGGTTAVAGGGWAYFGGATLFGAGATTTSGAAGATGAGVFGSGALAEGALGAGALSGGAALVVIGLGIAAIAGGCYIAGWFDSSSSSTPAPAPGPSSENDPPQGFQSGDGTEVYGATSDTDATAIANALNGRAPVDPSAIPSDPPSAPICPTSICPTVPICATAVASNQGVQAPNGPQLPGPGCIGVCPETGLPVAGCPGSGCPGFGDV